MFCEDLPTGENTSNIWLDGDDRFDTLITPSVAADLAHYLRMMPPRLQELLERLEQRAKQR